MEPHSYRDLERPASPSQEQPDFALIYAFLGSLFDPSCSSLDHMDVLKHMKDVDRQTATLLMRNVVNNLHHPEAWQEHVRLLQKSALEELQQSEGESKLKEKSVQREPHFQQFQKALALANQPSPPSSTADASS